MTSIVVFTKFAIAADQALIACCNDLAIPFVQSYPRNCCELISVHVGLAMGTANPKDNVKIARAYSRNNNEWHYWVEMDDLVLDLTAHQFEECKQPLVCFKPSPFESRFSDIERISIGDAEREAQFTVFPKLVHIFLECYQVISSTSFSERLR